MYWLSGNLETGEALNMGNSILKNKSVSGISSSLSLMLTELAIYHGNENRNKL
jgi:hypothetical protein